MEEVFVKINGATHYLWLDADHEGKMLESYVTKRSDRKAASNILRELMMRYDLPHVIVTDRIRSCGAALKVISNTEKQEAGRWLNN